MNKITWRRNVYSAQRKETDFKWLNKVSPLIMLRCSGLRQEKP